MATSRFSKSQQRRGGKVRFLLFFLILSSTFFLVFVWTGFEVAAILREHQVDFNPYLPELRASFPKLSSLSILAPLIDTQNRSFIFNPITAEESKILTRQDKSGMRAAVCHRTLFGNKISLDPLFTFVSYYRLMGFDHIFFWYRPNIAELPRFEELSSLPYVTMTEYTGGGRTEGQLVVEEECLGNSTFAADYNWTLTIDADEYLWFNSHISVKEFLSVYNANYTFLSFGKWMYTMLHGVKVEEDSGFGFDSYAFTAGSHCSYDMNRTRNHPAFPRNVSYMYCPWHMARSKILAKPAYHKKVNIHGMGFSFKKPGLLHFDTSIAHLKEWRGILVKRRGQVDYRAPESFKASKLADIVNFARGYEHVDGKVLIEYDSKLRDWMRFVASGCRK